MKQLLHILCNLLHILNHNIDLLLYLLQLQMIQLLDVLHSQPVHEDSILVLERIQLSFLRQSQIKFHVQLTQVYGFMVSHLHLLAQKSQVIAVKSCQQLFLPWMVQILLHCCLVELFDVQEHSVVDLLNHLRRSD